MVDEKLINRINELSRKSKNVGLTEEEKAEQQELRKIYINAFKGNLKSTLDNTVIIDPQGNKKYLRKQ